MLTAGRCRVLGLCREADVDGGRRRRNGVGEEAMWWCSEPADPPNRSVQVLRRCFGGQGSPVYAGGEDLK